MLKNNHVLLIWINLLNFNSLHVQLSAKGWDSPSSMEVPIVFTHSHLLQKDSSKKAWLKGNWGTGDYRQRSTTECRRMIQHPFRTDSMRTNLKTGNFFYVHGFTLLFPEVFLYRYSLLLYNWWMSWIHLVSDLLIYFWNVYKHILRQPAHCPVSYLHISPDHPIKPNLYLAKLFGTATERIWELIRHARLPFTSHTS